MLAFTDVDLLLPTHKSEETLPGISKVWRYLSERGISRLDVDDLGLRICKACDLIGAARKSVYKLKDDGRAAIVFPHHSLGNGDPLPWWSARLVPISEAPLLKLVHSFHDLVDTGSAKPRGKMFCPPGEPPRAYMPNILQWSKLRDGQRVYIHESAIKAINGAKCGKWSIGLNGVWGWRSARHEVALVEELRALPWRALNLQPVIVFDSNLADNWDVQHAAQRLAEKIYEISGCAKAQILRLPKKEDETDQGFDDFVQSVGISIATQWLEQEGAEFVDMDPVSMARVRLNNEVVVVKSMGKIAEQDHGWLMTGGQFADINYADRVVVAPKGEGGTKVESINVPRRWLAWKDRRTVDALGYEPGRPKICRTEEGEEVLNLWTGWGTEPEPGDVGPWLQLISNNISDPWLAEWLIQWLAYPLQNPGVKMNSNLLLFGPSGTGKNQLINPIHDIYGAGVNSVVVSGDQLASTFNSIYAQRQFVHADELVRGVTAVTGPDRVSQKLKMLVTEPRLLVNKKSMPEYLVRNTLNLCITSNYWDCVRLDEDDRRMAVIRWEPISTEVDHRRDEPYWDAYTQWWKNGGAPALHYYLLGVDLKGFNPMGSAPNTEWKKEVSDAGADSMELWCRELVRDADSVLPPTCAGRRLFSGKELATYYYLGQEVTVGRVMALGHALRNTGVKKAADGKKVRTKDGRMDRYWVVGGGEWEDLDVCAAHLKIHGM